MYDMYVRVLGSLLQAELNHQGENGTRERTNQENQKVKSQSKPCRTIKCFDNYW